jgi:hypothetical protein
MSYVYRNEASICYGWIWSACNNSRGTGNEGGRPRVCGVVWCGGKGTREGEIQMMASLSIGYHHGRALALCLQLPVSVPSTARYA